MNFSPELQTIISRFVSELGAALQKEATAALNNALGGGADVPEKRRQGRPRKTATAAAPRGPARRKGAKRSPEALEELTKTLGAYIKRNPGQRIEAIGKELGVTTKELQLPVAKLWQAKQIKTTGVRRATKYFPK